MAGTTTYYGISYPTSTDYVKDGATAMQTIADGFDSAVAIPTYNNQTGTSYTFVLADAGKTVTSDNASAVTFTIPPQTSVAWANNTTLTVRNLGAGVVTIAGGAGVTVTNTAQTVAQYGEVKLIRTASNAWTVVPAGGAGGLTLIKTQTIGSAVSSVAVTGAFSTTYENYKILITDGVASTNMTLKLQLGASTTAYYANGVDVVYATNTTGTGASNNAASWNYTGSGSTNHLQANIDLAAPFLTKYTILNNADYIADTYAGKIGGIHKVAASYTDFTLITSTGTMTGGTIRVYGYQK